METNKFWDQNIKAKVEETEITPPSFVWDQIEAQLPSENRIITFSWATFSKIAAAVLLFLGAGIWWLINEKSVVTPHSTKTEWAKQTVTPSDIITHQEDKITTNTNDEIRKVPQVIQHQEESKVSVTQKWLAKSNVKTISKPSNVTGVVKKPQEQVQHLARTDQFTKIIDIETVTVEAQPRKMKIQNAVALQPMTEEELDDDDDVVLETNIPGLEKGIQKVKATRNKINHFLAKVIRKEDDQLTLDFGRIEIVSNIN